MSNPSAAANTIKNMLAAFTALCNGGSLRIYNGTKPANADTAITTQTQLVGFTLGNPAFGVASGGVLTANAVTPSVAIATGTATWCRIFAADGTTVVFDGDVGTSGCDVNLASTTITSGDIIGVTSFSMSMPLT